jgi:hypothetical protein
MSEKVVFRSRRDPKTPVSADDLDLAVTAAIYRLEDKLDQNEGPPGPQGEQGPRGFEGLPGKDGAERFTELKDTPSSFAKQAGKVARVNRAETGLEFADPPTRTLSIGGGGGSPGPAGPPGPQGIPGAASIPRSATLTRDSNGSVETVTVEGENTWTISRNPNSSVASLTDTVYLVEVDRDGSGIVTGVTASEL